MENGRWEPRTGRGLKRPAVGIEGHEELARLLEALENHGFEAVVTNDKRMEPQELKKLEPLTGIEPVTSSLPRKCSTN